MNSHVKATSAAAAVGILVGAAMVSTKVVSNDFSPATLAFLRYLIGIAVLVIPVGLARKTRFVAKDACAIAMLGIFQFAVLILLLNYALLTLSATTCALVFSTMPLFTLCLALVTRREVYRTSKVVGVVLAVAGVVYLLNASAHDAEQSISWLGMMAIIAATLTGSVTSILYAPYLRWYPALPTCALAMGAAVLFLSVVCLATSQPTLPSMNSLQWVNVIIVGLSSGVGFLCWLWALGRMDASRVVAFQALGPVTAAVIELIIAQRPPSLSLLLSLALVTGGLILATRHMQQCGKASGD